MKLSLLLRNFLIITVLFLISCSSSTSSKTEELSDGRFTARVENGTNFEGDAIFEIAIPSSDRFQNAFEDSVLFLTLKTGEITNEREFNGAIIEYTINIGLSLNSLWKTNVNELDIGSTLIQNLFIQPNTLEAHDIRSGTIKIDEKSEKLMAGSIELIAVNGLSKEVHISGKFRATIK